MKQLIGQKEADKRIEESNKKSIVRQMEKKRKDTMTKRCDLQEEIASQVGRNVKTVDRQIGMTPKFVLVGRMSREEAVYYHVHWGHKTNAEVAEIMGISVSSVHNAKRKLQDRKEYADV